MHIPIKGLKYARKRISKFLFIWFACNIGKIQSKYVIKSGLHNISDRHSGWHANNDKFAKKITLIATTELAEVDCLHCETCLRNNSSTKLLNVSICLFFNCIQIVYICLAFFIGLKCSRFHVKYFLCFSFAGGQQKSCWLSLHSSSELFMSMVPYVSMFSKLTIEFFLHLKCHKYFLNQITYPANTQNSSFEIE